MAKQLRKEYTNGEVTIVWKPHLCIHSEKCVHTLPDVYNPKERPWIKPNNASTEAIIAQVKTCPSAALTYYMNDGTTEQENEETMETKIEVSENGPLLVHGNCQIVHIDGQTETKKRTTAFCRCGVSANKPFCDGSHITAKFEG